MEVATSLVGVAVRGQRPLLPVSTLELWRTSFVVWRKVEEGDEGPETRRKRGRRRRRRGWEMKEKGMKKEVKYYII